MPLTLTHKGETSLCIDLDGITPAWALGKTLAEIRRVKVLHGNRMRALEELFDLEGDTDDLSLVFSGDLSHVHRIGARMSDGQIRVDGNAGRHTGSQMTGGRICVHGDVGDWLGAEMRNGLIQVSGHAGDGVGAALRGSPRGMTGGTILVDGDVGNELGRAMRRGMIAVGGRAGKFPGFEMLAGTVIVLGNCGRHPAAGMRRGTLGLFGRQCPELLGTFGHACTIQQQILPVILNRLRELGFDFDDDLPSIDCEVFSGDQVALGRGEILVRHEMS